ncbi:MAG: sigma-70 family RNA polymerase sigma factor [Clostridia bacterium]|nr:sigma-70 family RNA polymerase sigma factor [Clostridia bacterium]
MNNKKEDADAHFRRIYAQTAECVWRYILGKCASVEDGRDLLQDVFTELYVVLRTKDADYIRDPQAFVLRLAADRIARYYKKLPRRPTPFSALSDEENDEDITAFLAAAENTENEAITRAAAEAVRANLRSRDFDTQRIFYFYYNRGLTLAEIAALTGRKESWVKAKLYRTLKNLRKIYTDGEDSK